jgi:hypothetical protein
MDSGYESGGLVGSFDEKKLKVKNLPLLTKIISPCPLN